MRYCLSFLLALIAVPCFADQPSTPIEPEAVSLDRPVDYTRDIAPILEANCLACHNQGIDESGLSLEDVVGMLKGGDRGPAIVTGKPDKSLLLAVASHRTEPIMPPIDNDVEARTLTPRELGLIRQWILEGAGKGQNTAERMIAWQSLPRHLTAIRSVALSPTNRFLAVGRANQIEVYDLALGRPAARLIDPNLSSLKNDGTLLYSEGAADRDLVLALDFSPDGMTLASGGYRAIKLWRRTKLGEVTPFDATDATAIAISRDGEIAAIAIGSEVRQVSLGDQNVTGAHSLPGKVVSLAMSEDAKSIAAACEDQSLHIWTTGDGTSSRAVTVMSRPTRIAFLGTKLVSAHEDGVLRVWPEMGDVPGHELKGHDGAVRSVSAIAGQPSMLVSGGEDGTIRFWDVASGKMTRSLAHGAPVTDIAITEDGRSLVSCGADGAVRFWNMSDGKKQTEFIGRISFSRELQGAKETSEWRKQLAAVADAAMKEAEAAVKEREEIHKKAIEAKEAAEKALDAAKKANEEAKAAAESAAEQLAAKSDDETLKKQSDEAAKKAAEANAAVATAETALASATRSVSLADEALATARQRFDLRQQTKKSADEAVIAAESLVSAMTAEAAKTSSASDVEFSPAGFAVATYSDGTIQTFSPAGVPLDEIRHEKLVAKQCAFVADGRLLVLSEQGTVQHVNVAGSWAYDGVLGPKADSPLELSHSTLNGRVLALAFSPDGTQLASGGGLPSRNGELIIWNLFDRSSVKVEEPHSDTVEAIDFSRDGQRIATAAADKFAKVFDARTGALVRTFEGHTDQVLGVSFKADGTSIATASADLSVKIWNVETGEQRRTISGFGKQVTAIHFVGLSEDVISSAGDRTVRAHRTSNGQQLRAFLGATDFVHAVAVSNEGSIVAAGGEDGVLFVWDGTNAQVRHKFEAPSAEATTTAEN